MDIPEEFSRELVAGTGNAGRAWLASLPTVVDELVERWNCTPAGEVRHGRVGIVLSVRRGRSPAVLKVSYPGFGSSYEPTALAAWNGSGAVRLYERDDAHTAVLLEQAGPRTLADIDDPERAVTIQGRLSHRLAIPAPPGLPALGALVGDWERKIDADYAAFGDALPDGIVEQAKATLRELGTAGPDMLIHGDLHDANILAGDREPWLAIDPKVHVGDPAYEALYVFLSPRFGPLLTSPDPRPELHRLLDVYCAAAEVDRDRARRWIQAGAVREALRARRAGDPEPLIQACDALATAMT